MAAKRSTGFTMSRRNELARERGFTSYAQQRNFSPAITNAADLQALPPDAREARQQALDVLAMSRRDGGDLATVARREGVSVSSVAWWVGDAAHKSGGRWQPSSADRIYRPMYVYSGGEAVPIDVRGSKAASTVGGYHAAVRQFLRTGDSTDLERFDGRKVGGLELETDLDVIEEMHRRGEFDFESIYRMVD